MAPDVEARMLVYVMVMQRLRELQLRDTIDNRAYILRSFLEEWESSGLIVMMDRRYVRLVSTEIHYLIGARKSA